MKTPTSLLLGMAPAASLAGAETVNFDRAAVGQAPPGWTAAITGQGQPGWTVEHDESAPSKLAVLFNGNRLFEVEDETFQQAGKVGLWTKADSVTASDDFSDGTR